MGKITSNLLNVRTSLSSFAQDVLKPRIEIANELEQVFGVLACELSQ